MALNPVSVLLFLAFIYPLLRGVIRAFSSDNLKSDLRDIEGDISFIISLISGFFLFKKIFLVHEEGIYSTIYNLIPGDIRGGIEGRKTLLYIAVLPVIVFLLYKASRLVFVIINHITIYPILDSLERILRNRSTTLKRLLGGIFELPRAMSYVLILTFIINVTSMVKTGHQFESLLAESKVYNYLCREVVIPITNSRLARQLPSIINNSFRVEEVQNTDLASVSSRVRTIVYYNGVTLEEGVKSNSEIDKFAQELVKNETSDKGRARKIYTWVGSSIAYDHEKAAKVMNNNFSMKSGAIPAFEERKGICFDYSCLYVAMARVVGLKVRLVTGEGFNGISWVSHAWNQVYIEEDGKWINVDPTFYKGGNYFNSRRFDLDHKDAKIAQEW